MANYINFDGVVSTNYIAVGGVHVLTIKSVEFGTSSSGTPFHRFTCANSDDEIIKYTLYITDKSLWKYKQFMELFGFKLKGNVDVEQMSNAAVGKTFVGELDTKTTTKMEMNEDGIPEEREVKFLEIVKVRVYTQAMAQELAKQKQNESENDLPF